MTLKPSGSASVTPDGIDGDDALPKSGLVAAFDLCAGKVFGHRREFTAEIARYPRMRRKTRQLIAIYERLDAGFASYFDRTGLNRASNG